MDDSSNLLFMRGFIQPLALERGKFGPAPRFFPEDAVRALWRLEKRTGRASLARSLGVGEGTARTIIASLSGKGLVDSAPMGHKLTVNGAALLSGLKEKVVAIRHVPQSRLTFGLSASAVQLRCVRLAQGTVALRDEMVRSGARGCTALRFEKGRLVIPPFHAPTHREYSSELSELSKLFSLEEKDLLLVAYGGDRNSTERALWAACRLLHV